MTLTSARKVVREPPEVKSWIICDGDIDPEWVESLNSVLVRARVRARARA